MDPVITIGGVLPKADQLNEVPMSWYLHRGSYMISPYLDLLSHFFHPAWRSVGVRDRVGLMIKLADSANGSVDEQGNVQKSLTEEDGQHLNEAIGVVESILSEAGVHRPFAQGMVNGGHLGGTRPLRPEDVDGMRPSDLPEGLWLADLSLVPRSQGMPTMLLAAALGLRVARTIVRDRA